MGDFLIWGRGSKGNLRLLDWEEKSLLDLLCMVLLLLGFDIHHSACIFFLSLVQSIVKLSLPAWP